jgi:hypothetical protein
MSNLIIFRIMIINFQNKAKLTFILNLLIGHERYFTFYNKNIHSAGNDFFFT